MYKVVSCRKELLNKKIEKINKENLKIISVTTYNSEFYDIVVEEVEKVVY